MPNTGKSTPGNTSNDKKKTAESGNKSGHGSDNGNSKEKASDTGKKSGK